MRNNSIVVVIPCFNEEATIEKVVRDFRRELPSARIVVVDNNSTDETNACAKSTGADVVCEQRQGKGYAVQHAFALCKEDIVVLVDGDDTYKAEDVHELISIVADEKADMAVGNRMHRKNKKAFSLKHWWGNKFLNAILKSLFRVNLHDMQSGLRVMNKKFVDTAILLVGGFAIEPEMTIQAIEKNLVIKERRISLHERIAGSNSKINTVRDGTIALYTLVSLFRDYKPLQFFSLIAFTCLAAGVWLGWYGTKDYFETGLVTRIPSLIVSVALLIASFMSFIAGLILSSIKRRHEELGVILSRISQKEI